MELRYSVDKETIRVYHHVVLGLAAIKNCPLINENDYAIHSVMTHEWFNRIIDWLCLNYPDEFMLKNV